ncbi:phosphatidylinositol-glycan biosynthesis class S protein [Diplocarpon rosae]|nr:phosphatidylinositol-glycan biosynthesis class S protein [Diplocarpon rosae]
MPAPPPPPPLTTIPGAGDDGSANTNDASATTVGVAFRRKEAPPESPESIRLRRWIIASFWAIVIFIGLPIWWKTTTIHRETLPLDQMMDWADGRACRPVFPLRISIEADSLQEEVALKIRVLPGKSTASDLQSYAPVLDIHYTPNQIPSVSSSSSPLGSYIANTLRGLFAEEQAMIAYLLSTSSAPPERSPKALAPEVAESLAKWRTRSMKYSRTYHLTFSLFTPSAVPSTWDIEAALKSHMAPLLSSLSPISNFTIDTQVQLYATPGVSGSILQKADLSGFINAAEWPLSPSIGGAPTVNFILYVGNMSVEGGGKSWLIPQWGGVVIQSDIQDLRPAMLIFANQLMSLLGAPESGSLPLRLMTLMRVRSAGLLLKASGTMGSLARLTLALPSISIPRSVADGVYTTIEHLRKACGGLSGTEGLENARIAEEAAEKAFFEKSMVGQVYFPDEHKVAVYMPLLGPMAVPLVMGAVKEIKAWSMRRRRRK